MPIISVQPPTMAAPSSAANPGTAGGVSATCGDLSQLQELQGIGKYDSKKLFKSLLGFALGMLPGPMGKIASNQEMLPQEFPGFGALLGAASMLLDPQGGVSGLQGLWGAVSGNAHGEYAAIASGFGGDVQSLAAAFATFPKVAVSTDSIAIVRAAAERIVAGASPQNAGIQAAMSRACFTFGGDTQRVFDLYGAATSLQGLAGDLRTSLGASARVFSASGNALSTIGQLSANGINQQFTQAGVTGLGYDIDQIRSIANLPSSAFNTCGPDMLRTVSILQQACRTATDFYSTAGFGNFDWEQMTLNFIDSVSAAELQGIADRAAGFSSFTPDGVIGGITNHIDGFLAQALCSGGSDNLANGFVDGFGKKVGEGLTAVATVATIYATIKQLTDSFKTTLSVMNQLGANKAINSMVGGNFAELFGLASGSVTNEQISKLRGIRDCLQQRTPPDPQALAIVSAELQKAESVANTKWAMTLKVFDANGYFNSAQKFEEAKSRVKNNIANNTPIKLGIVG